MEINMGLSFAIAWLLLAIISPPTEWVLPKVAATSTPARLKFYSALVRIAVAGVAWLLGFAVGKAT